MFNTSNCGYSLADIAAATCGSGRNSNGDGDWSGNGAWWIIILFLFVFCGWGNGFGGFGGYGNGGGGINSPAGQGALTRGDLCMDMNFAELKSAAQNGVDATNLGFANLNSTICQQQYDTAQMINGLQGTIQGGFNSTNVALLQGQNALASQIANCCCEEREAIQGVNYNMAQNTCAITNQMNNNTRDIIQSQEAGTRAILDYLCQDKISTLQSENQGLRLAASQQAQNNYLISQLRPLPVPAYPAASPCGLGNWSPAVLANGFGYSGGCGCGCSQGYTVA